MAGQQGARKTWCEINAQSGSRTAELLIYDRIGGYWSESSAMQVADKIKDLDVDAITVRINSPGGSAFDGIAIMNTLRTHKATVTVHIDGLAASAASVIAMAGDEIVMGPASQMMIHDAWTYTDGDAKFLRSEADRLDKLSGTLAALYARRANGTAEDWRELMLAETWFTGEEAVEAGLADRVDGEPIEAADLASFNLAQFRFAGRDHAPAPTISPAAEAGANREERPMATLIESLRERLGVAQETDEAAVLAALDEALAEQVEPESLQSKAAQLPDGVVMIESSVLDELKANAAAGAAARAKQVADERGALVSAAIKDGRIATARKDHWLAALEADPEGAAESLAALAPGLIPVAEFGHGVSTAGTETEDLSWFGQTPTASKED